MGHYAELKMFGHAFDSTFDKAVERIQKDLQGWNDEYTQRQIPPHFAYLWSADYIPPKDFDGLIANWNTMRQTEQAPKIQYSTPEQFLDAVSAEQPALEELCGERPNMWLYIHGPTHHYAITAKREAGVLLPAAEMFATIEVAVGREFRPISDASNQPHMDEHHLRRSWLGW